MPDRKRRYVKPGERIRIVAPYSEVMIYFKLAGRPIEVELVEKTHAGSLHHVAQIYVDGEPRSSPVTYSEAGFYHDYARDEFYTYEDDGPGDEDPETVVADLSRVLLNALSGRYTSVVTDLGLNF